MFKKAILPCLLCLFALLAACQPEGDGDGGVNNVDVVSNNDNNDGANNANNGVNNDQANNDANNGVNNDANNGGGVELAPCEGNTDCRGGEVCREGLCREACSQEDPCVGPLGTCDLEQGYCVGCVEDADCGADQACDGEQSCVFFCRSDAACGEGQFCDDQGQCQEAECAQDADCPGGFRCADALCEPIDDLVCTPDSSRCVDNVLVSCSRDGTREESQDCQNDLCVNEEGGARCLPLICEPNSIGCQGDGAAYTCNSLGTAQETLDCGQNQICHEGVCRDLLCEPEAATCQGDTLLICAEDGLSQVEQACQEGCQAEAGCTCQEGACVPRVCVPGDAACVGNAVRTCREDGLGYEELLLCEGEEVCVSGGCVDPTCQPGQTECAGDNLLTCSQDGTRRTEVSCQDQGAFCGQVDGQAACVPHVCEPGQPLCQGDTAATCNARGNGVQEGVVDCAAQDQICQSGRCVSSCGQEGARRCQGNTVLVCQEDRVTEEPIACAEGRRCEEGQCVAQFCTPNEPACDGQRAVVCDALGSDWRDQGEDCAASDMVCQSGRCVQEAPPCPTAQARVRVSGTDTWTQQLTASPLDTIELDASASQGAATYLWSVVGRPQGSTSRLANSGSERASLFLDLAGTYVVELTVFDEQGEEACQTSRVSINAVSQEAILVQLTWSTPNDTSDPEMGTDLDLHLLHPNGGWDDQRWDCFWRNPTPDWGVAGDLNDPSQDIDDVNGEGPENITLGDPEVLNYNVGVYYYNDNGYGASYATLRIWLNGVLTYNMQDRYLEREDLFWHAARVRWFGQEGDVQQVNTIFQGIPSAPSCDSDQQCSGDQVCLEGRCQDAPDNGCTDAYEPNESSANSAGLSVNRDYDGLTLCGTDEDWFGVLLPQNAEATTVVEYTPSSAHVIIGVYDTFLGDLELFSAVGSDGRAEITASPLFLNQHIRVYSPSNHSIEYSIRVSQ